MSVTERFPRAAYLACCHLCMCLIPTAATAAAAVVSRPGNQTRTVWLQQKGHLHLSQDQLGPAPSPPRRHRSAA